MAYHSPHAPLRADVWPRQVVLPADWSHRECLFRDAFIARLWVLCARAAGDEVAGHRPHLALCGPLVLRSDRSWG